MAKEILHDDFILDEASDVWIFLGEHIFDNEVKVLFD